jgi:hypothetical protein
VKRGLLDSRKKLELIVFKKKVPGKIFTPRKEKVTKVTGDWEKVHYEGLGELYLSPCIVNGVK